MKHCTTSPKVIVSVVNDLLSDNRVDKTCRSLQKAGYEVLLVGRQLRNSPPMNPRPYDYQRMKLLFERGVLFYAELNFRLFLKLLFQKSTLLWANDLDTLGANYMVSLLKRIPLIYDSHEHFTETPELNGRPFKKKIWKLLERSLVPRLQYVFTVCHPIADYFHTQYSIEARIVRNIPPHASPSKHPTALPDTQRPHENLLLWQGGGCNIDRGLEELIAAMPLINAHLYIIGGGDIFAALQQTVKELNLETKVTLLSRMPFEEMMQYTRHATLGLCIDKPTNKNYLISLPNKLFDYIRAELPMVVSPLPEIKKIVDKYKIGTYLVSYDPRQMAKQINDLLADKETLNTYKQNLKTASAELSWENEEKEIFDLLNEIALRKP